MSAITLKNVVPASGGVVFLNNANVQIQNTTQSTSSTSGALVLSGGIGIVNTADATSITNGGTFTTAGGAAIAKRLFVGGSTRITNTDSISGSRIIGDSLSSITNPFGDFQGNGQFLITGATATAKRLALGYDTVNDYSVIQSVESGVATKALYLNPTGGSIVTGSTGSTFTIRGTTASTSNVLGALLLAGGIGISNTTDATSATNGGTITTAGGAAIAKKLFVGGITTSTDTTASTSNVLGALLLAGGIGISNTTDATSATNGGTITTAGGVGVAKRLYVGSYTKSKGYETDTILNIKSYGAVGDGVTDDLAIIQSAITYANANGINCIYFPAGTYIVSDTVYFEGTNILYLGEGNDTVIKLVRGVSTNWVVPLIVIPTTSEFVTIQKFKIDHDAENLPQASQSTTPGNVAIGYLSAIVIKGDNCTLKELSIYNAWDNSVAVFGGTNSGDGSPGNPFYFSQVAGTPENAMIYDCYAERSGCGFHELTFGDGRAGGFNNLSGKNCRFINCVAESCYNGFILDFGAGAQGSFINCRANNTITDGTPVGSGKAFYVGSSNSNFVNCSTSFAATLGWFIDGFANYCSFINCDASDSKEEGFVIASDNITLVGCKARANSRDNTNVYSGFRFSTYNDVRYKMIGCISEGFSRQKYGIEETTSGGKFVYGELYGCRFFNNVTADVNIGNTTTYLRNSDGALSLSTPTASTSNTTGALLLAGGIGISNTTDATSITNGGTFTTAGGAAIAKRLFVGNSTRITNTSTTSGSRIIGDSISSITDAFGDSTTNGQFYITGATTTAKRLAMGYDTVNDYSVIQSIEAGVATKGLYLNPTGGSILTGSTSSTFTIRGTTASTSDILGSLLLAGGIGISNTTDAISATNGGTFTTAGGVGIAKKLFIGGTTTSTNTTASTSNTTGALLLAGGIGISNTTDATSATNGGTLTTAGGAAIAKKLYVGDTTASTSNTTGALLLAGGIGISNTTDATSITNGGTFTTAGGAAIAKRLFVGNSTRITNTSTTSGSRIIGDSISSITDAFGDATTNGQFYITGATTANKRLAMGYDTVNDFSVIQSIEAGVATKQLYLNPNGGGVVSGSTGSTFTIRGTTTSTSNTTGALLLAGGIGISNTTDATSATNGGTFTTAGGAAIAKKLFVGTDLNVGGTLTKTAGSFVIDHPDPEKRKQNYKLKHCFVESNTRGDNIYRFNVSTTNLKAVVSLPDYFKYINENIHVYINCVDALGYGFGKIDDKLENINIQVSNDGKYNVLVIGTRTDKEAIDFFEGRGGAEFV